MVTEPGFTSKASIFSKRSIRARCFWNFMKVLASKSVNCIVVSISGILVPKLLGVIYNLTSFNVIKHSRCNYYTVLGGLPIQSRHSVHKRVYKMIWTVSLPYKLVLIERRLVFPWGFILYHKFTVYI